MIVRRFEPGNERELWQLFYNTIHQINSKDYDKAQIAAWAQDNPDVGFLAQKYKEINPFVVHLGSKIIAYADIQADGYIDHFYCHHEYQGIGIGRMLFTVLEKNAKQNRIEQMYSNVSITARPFFEAMGFAVEKEQRLTMGNQQLKNYRMVRTVKLKALPAKSAE